MDFALARDWRFFAREFFETAFARGYIVTDFVFDRRSEAPRGLLFHRYEVDRAGTVRRAQIVPPTSQNQAAIEADLTAFAPSVLGLSHAEATLRLEQLIRSYDPCISCATHFLDLRIEPADR